MRLRAPAADGAAGRRQPPQLVVVSLPRSARSAISSSAGRSASTGTPESPAATNGPRSPRANRSAPCRRSSRTPSSTSSSPIGRGSVPAAFARACSARRDQHPAPVVRRAVRERPERRAPRGCLQRAGDQGQRRVERVSIRAGQVPVGIGEADRLAVPVPARVHAPGQQVPSARRQVDSDVLAHARRPAAVGRTRSDAMKPPRSLATYSKNRTRTLPAGHQDLKRGTGPSCRGQRPAAPAPGRQHARRAASTASARA